MQPKMNAVTTLLEDFKEFFEVPKLTLKDIHNLSILSAKEHGYIVQNSPEKDHEYMVTSSLCCYKLLHWHLTEPAFQWPVLPPPHENAIMCDFGAGIGTRGIQYIIYGWNVDFVEINIAMSKFIKFRLEKNNWNGNVYDKIDTNKGYDFVLACDVVGHLSDPIGTINDITASIKQGGQLHVTLDNLLIDDEHKNREIDFPKLIEQNGFERKTEWLWEKK